MRISDSFLRSQLQNVLWIGGAGYGGKTTITDLLTTKHGFVAYHPEDVLAEHKRAASAKDHPALLAAFHGWEWFFSRPIEEYIKAIDDANREHFEMVVLDLVRMSAASRVVVDGYLLEPSQMERLTEPCKIIFLYAEEEIIRKSFFARKDKRDLLGVINTLPNPAKTREHVLEMVCTHSARKRAAAEMARMKVLVRDAGTDLRDTLRMVEQHFGLG